MTLHLSALDSRGLRKFGLATGITVVMLFALFFPWVFDATSMPVWPWIIAAMLWVPALGCPRLLNPVYVAWMKIGYALGWINSRVILGIVFYSLVLPMGLIMRLIGNDPMARKHDQTTASYRVQSTREPKERLEKPF
ncbi:MAG: sxtJ [Gammaproteobacteria bacterium]|nr:sxtJ [Gammaproteobacteria bacterium]